VVAAGPQADSSMAAAAKTVKTKLIFFIFILLLQF
jgi:hypothetical protein